MTEAGAPAPAADQDSATAGPGADHDTVAAPTGPGGSARFPLWRRSVRWVVAGAVFLGLGAGTAYGITSAPRDRVPGLATRSDGRWDFPALSLPALPARVPRPFPDGRFTSDNRGEIHFADLRRLLVPAPSGVTADRSLNGGWTEPARFLGEYPAQNRDTLRQYLADDGLRHITARGWTAPDGTSLHVYLAQFQSAGNMLGFLQGHLGPGVSAGLELDGVTTTMQDGGWPGAVLISGTRTDVYRQIAPFSGTHTRMAYIEAGDTLALIVEKHRGSDAPAVPFHQTVILQQQLLG
ncbi:hypothetical protein [Streptomyces sp. NBC_01497]|uniref:hypothetical protein n=1 Tax=Streptomyces sp. NBC_01497 TaxID=2903885 RepID=UPI002E2EDCF8|nr:hypothetical protein [Streptomyces sp. NBC_01497]